VNAAAGRCLAIAGGVTTGSPQLVVADCDSTDANQRWTAPSRAGVSASGPVWSVGAPKLCAGLWTANEPGNAPVVAAQCQGQDYQRLALADDGTIRVQGQCVELPWGVTADGTGVQINPCPTPGSEQWSPHQLWTATATGQLVNSASSRCLTVAAGTTTSGKQLVADDCDPANPLQRWVAPRKAARSSTSYTYNNADQLTSSTDSGGATTAYGYDPNGNQTSAGSTTSTFDLANRTTSTTSGATATSFTYDGVGKRLTKATNGTVDTRFSWDPNNALPQLAAETTNGGGLIRRYANGIDGPLSMTGAGGTSYYHRDALGSISDVTSASGAAQWAYSYEPFGAARSTTMVDPAAPANPMQYTGQYLDAGTGQYHLRARQYDPDLGRFTVTDPLAPPIIDPYVSAYAYAGNQPTMFDDPSGMKRDWLYTIAKGVDDHNPFRAGINAYKAEIRAYECGASYWDSVKLGLVGAAKTTVAAVEVAVVVYGGAAVVNALPTIALAEGGFATTETLLNTSVAAAAVVIVLAPQLSDLMRQSIEALQASIGSIYRADDGEAGSGGGASTAPTGTSANQLNQEIRRGRAPKGIKRVDKANPDIPGNQDHVHIDGQRETLNRDGTWGHGAEPGELNNEQREWLRGHGWNV
jgi:RHS repeat-associated protein